MRASEAATQPLPQYVCLNFDKLFKIQPIRNAFPLQPVSFSRLTAYLECPCCALDQRKFKRSKEPIHFTDLEQQTLFKYKNPDPRLLGTLLHLIVNLLHEPEGPLSEQRRTELCTSPEQLVNFIRTELVDTLRSIGKMRLAMFHHQLNANYDRVNKTVLQPILRYQRELWNSSSQVFAGSERFQFKLLSTRHTFKGHRDWGGYVGLVGEFDQIRMRSLGSVQTPGGVPAIMEFKKGLGKKKTWDLILADDDEDASDELELPGMAHAMQLMIYWLAFQTRWDVMGHITSSKGRSEEVRMPIRQDLDLILYDLHDGQQYRLVPTDFPGSLQAMINCIFHLNWAMKSGYAQQAEDHICRKTALLAEVNLPPIEVGYSTISAEECYQLARAAFERFKATVNWEVLPIR